PTWGCNVSARDEVAEPDRRPGLPHPREALSLIGQVAAERGFLDAWATGRLHHAWMLRGPAGVGKATLAYRIARALIADGDGDPPADLSAPADCPVRRRILAGSEPRLAVLRRPLNERTGRLRTQIGVDEVRALRSFLALSAPDGGWRAIIVDAADEMTVQAANALLKGLEEPPARTVFLLVTHAAGRLLPTIRSRTRVLDLGPLDPDHLATVLRGLGLEPDQAEAEALAALAGGSVGSAVDLANGGGIALYRELCRLLGPTARGFEVERGPLVALGESALGRQGEARYGLIAALSPLLAARLARAAGGAAPRAAMAEEARLLDHAGGHRALAPLLAEGAAGMSEGLAAARAVSLDPARTVMDTWLGFEAALSRPLQRA
ncbi:MAG: DNA polymerase III subunit delta', partial [Pseudomonadota bacterium]